MASTFGFSRSLPGGGDDSGDTFSLLLRRAPFEDRATGDCRMEDDGEDRSEVELSAGLVASSPSALRFAINFRNRTFRKKITSLLYNINI